MAKPILGLDSSASICEGTALDLTTQFSTAGLTTNWTSSGLPVPVPVAVNTDGVYQLIASNGSNCSDTALFTLVIDNGPDLGEDKIVNLCPGTTVDLADLFTTTGLTTSWTKAGVPVSNLAAVSTPGIYQLIAINAGSCSDTALVTINIRPSISLGADTAVTICTGSTLDLFSIYNTSGIIADWTLGGIPVTDPASVSAAGFYRLIAISGGACRDTAYLTVTSSLKPNVGIDKIDTICSGSPLNLNSQFNTAGLTLNWTLNGNPVTTPTAVVDSGLYRLIAINGTCRDTGYLQLAVKLQPSLGNDISELNCAGVLYDLTSLYSTTGLTAAWTFGGAPLSDSTAVSAPGTYRLIVANTNGCSDTAYFTINLLAKPDLGLDQSVDICTGQTTNLTGIYNTSGLNTSWSLAGIAGF